MHPLKSAFLSALTLVASMATSTVQAAVPGPVNVNVVNAPARQAFSYTRSCITSGQKACSIPKITVPSDKLLVIENISLTGSNEYNSQAHAHLSFYPVAGQSSSVYIPAVLLAEGHNLLSQPLRVYADAGTQVTLTGIFTDASTTGGFAMTVSGYFVDCATEYRCGP